MVRLIQSRYIDETVRLGGITSRLYMSFHSIFPADAVFWWELALQEKQHAALLDSWRQCFLETRLRTAEIVESLLFVMEKNNRLEQILDSVNELFLSRAEALSFALELEESTESLHFHKDIAVKLKPQFPGRYKGLQNGDRKHSRVIQKYMLSNDQLRTTVNISTKGLSRTAKLIGDLALAVFNR